MDETNDGEGASQQIGSEQQTDRRDERVDQLEIQVAA